ncbi:hypothetical protein FACS1894184_16860 [Clostridia bacterium]|nr:hypothetical protein FACS1894184_16860 [Clostridia bacterium]
MTFSEKVRLARERLELDQEELGKLVGVSRRSIYAYEVTGIIPRDNMLRKLAKALDVSVAYLMNEEIDDPDYGTAREAQVEAIRSSFGSRGVKDVKRLLEQSAAFFAGGDAPQEDKDVFFEAIMAAYLTCKETARMKYAKRQET